MASLTYGSVIGAGPGYTTVTTPQGPRTVVGDRAMRNNNPGNIEAGSYANSYGAIGSDGRFAVFGSRLTGTRAQAGLIFGKNYANLTLGQAIAKYAPSFENNTAAYAAAVAAAAGVSLDTKMKDIPEAKRAAVVAGMQAVEGNTQANVYDAQGNLVGTIDTTSPRTPAVAPTPYSADSQMADTTPGAPIGTVARAALGPPAPSQPGLFSGMATPRGINSLMSNVADTTKGLTPGAVAQGVANDPRAAPGLLGTPAATAGLTGAVQAAQAAATAANAGAPSPDRPDNHNDTGPIGMGGPGGLYADQASADAANAATKAAASAERQAAAATAPAQAAPAIAPANVATAPTVAAPKISVPAMAPAVTPAAVPARAVAASSPSLATPSRPSLSPADVYGGAIGTAQTSTPGVTVSRVNSFGPSYVTNQFGVTTAMAPDGTMMAAPNGVPAAKPADISGPLDSTGISTQANTGGLFGPKAKAATGTLAGAALGAYALGPVGGLLGGLIGKNLAQGKPAFSGLLGGNNNANTHVVDTFQGQMRFANAHPGLGFPSAPSGPSPGGVAPGMRGLSPGAANAIDHGVGGLY